MHRNIVHYGLASMCCSLANTFSRYLIPQIDLFTNFGNLDEGVREMSLAELIGDLVNATRPRDEGLFPQDLNISLTILEGTIFELV